MYGYMMTATSYSDDSQFLTRHITCNGFCLILSSMCSQLTLETSIWRHRYQAYMTEDLCILNWIDWICMPYISPVHYYMCFLSPDDDLQILVANNVAIVSRMIRYVKLVGLLLVVMLTFQMVYRIYLWQLHALTYTTFSRLHICCQIKLTASWFKFTWNIHLQRHWISFL